MPDPQTIQTPAEQDAQVESAILLLLTDGDAQRPWSNDEVEREIGNATLVKDALRRLWATGLVHRYDGFAWATRAALRAGEVRL